MHLFLLSRFCSIHAKLCQEEEEELKKQVLIMVKASNGVVLPLVGSLLIVACWSVVASYSIKDKVPKTHLSLPPFSLFN